MIGAPDWSDNATLTASQAAGAFPVTNLQLMQPTDRWQTNNLTGPLSLTLDRGEVAAFNLVALLHANASEEASWRVRAAQTQAELDTAPVLDTSGGFGAHLAFDGETQYGSGSTASYGSLTDFTLETWVYFDQVRRQGIVARSGGATTAFLRMTPAGKLECVEIAGLAGQVTSAAAVAAGTWVHVAMAYDATAQEVELIVNGVSEGTASGVTTFAASGDTIDLSPLENDRLDGRLDDVRLWDFARTAAQVAADYQAELTGGESGLVGYWKLNDGNGTSASNTAAGPAITLTGSPLWAYPEEFWAGYGLGDWDRSHSLFFQAAGVAAQWVQVDILDPNNADGAFRAGRLYVSSAWQVSNGGRRFGSDLGWRDPSRRTVLPGGQVTVRRAAPRPAARFVVVCTDEDELMQTAYEIDRVRAGSKDVLVCFDPADANFAAHKMIHGLLSPELSIRDLYTGVFEHEYTIEGLI